MVVMNGLSFESKNKCFCLLNISKLSLPLSISVLFVCSENANANATAVANNNNSEILINYSCFSGLYIFEMCTPHATFKIKLFAISTKSFRIVYSSLSLFLYLTFERYLLFSNKDDLSSMIYIYISFCQKQFWLLVNFGC